MAYFNHTSLFDRIGTLYDVLSAIQARRGKEVTFLVGIDGLGGSGKTTFSQRIKRLEPSVEIVHLDDFYLPSVNRHASAKTSPHFGSDIDVARIRTQLMEPLAANKDAHFERYDWDSDTLAEILMIRSRTTVIIEGVYAFMPELISMYNLKVWIDCPRETRLARGLDRDGTGKREQWIQQWMPEEDRYLRDYCPMLKADIIVNGANDSAR